MMERWTRAQAAAAQYPGPVGIDRLRDMASHADAAVRRECVALIDRQVSPTTLVDYVPVLRSLASDADHICRWQSLILISGSIWSGAPDVAWEVVVEHADAEDEDLRAAIATLLLEELLDKHFEAYFPRVRDLARHGSPRTHATIGMCWFDGMGPRYRRVQKMLRNAGRGSSGFETQG